MQTEVKITALGADYAEYSSEELPNTFQCMASHEIGLPFRFLSVHLELPLLFRSNRSPGNPLKAVDVCFIGMFSIFTVPGNRSCQST